MNKTCKTCGDTKPLRDFYRRKPSVKYRIGEGARLSDCMDCWRTKMKARYHEKKQLRCEAA